MRRQFGPPRQFPRAAALKRRQHQPAWRLVSVSAKDREPVVIRIDMWKYRGRNPAPSAAELAALKANPPIFEDAFDQPLKPPSPPPIEETEEPVQVVKRPAVNPRENIDEFPPAQGRFLRFVVTRTNDGTAPGLDELEVYGADPKLNLALKGKASASSLVPGYAIHQFSHLNDGKLGNPNS